MPPHYHLNFVAKWSPPRHVLAPVRSWPVPSLHDLVAVGGESGPPSARRVVHLTSLGHGTSDGLRLDDMLERQMPRPTSSQIVARSPLFGRRDGRIKSAMPVAYGARPHVRGR